MEVSAPLANQSVSAKREFTFVLSRPPIMPLLRSLPSPRAYADVRGDVVAGFSLFHGARLVYAVYTAATGQFQQCNARQFESSAQLQAYATRSMLARPRNHRMDTARAHARAPARTLTHDRTRAHARMRAFGKSAGQ